MRRWRLSTQPWRPHIVIGARLCEIRWDWVHLESAMIRLPDSKTGAKPIYLNAPAIDVLENLPRMLDAMTGVGAVRPAPLDVPPAAQISR